MKSAVVVIGRNESSRLKKALDSIAKSAPTVYVDSQSADNSIELAQARADQVVNLKHETRISAGIARNRGFEQLSKSTPRDYVQFLDADCILDPSWLSTAENFLDKNPSVAAVCGFCRELSPEKSIYNLFCDYEWDRSCGTISTCGGIFMIRATVFAKIGGFSALLPAGEEAELFQKTRDLGWIIQRIPSPMVRHDANILSFGAWWRRSMRGGMATHLGLLLYSGDSHKKNLTECLRIIFWGLVMTSVIGAFFVTTALAMGLIAFIVAFGLRVFLNHQAKFKAPKKDSVVYSLFTIVEKVPRFLGFLRSVLLNSKKRGGSLFEYK